MLWEQSWKVIKINMLLESVEATQRAANKNGWRRASSEAIL